jgi:hypothetical protein
MPNSAVNTTVQQTGLSGNFRRLAPLWTRSATVNLEICLFVLHLTNLATFA